jgi:DNA-binding response OmpR family regulator
MPSKRLLIVDDDRATRSGLSELLARAGYECAAAGTYDEALSTLKNAPPDLLIADIRLGAHNGLQLVLHRPVNVPAIVITGFPDSVLESEAERSGAKYICKPVEPRQLLALIHEMLGDTPRQAAANRQ